MSNFRTLLRIAGRESRGGLGGFRVFLACLALGVAIIAGVGSIADSIESALRSDARRLLGGDAEFRLVYRAADPAELKALEGGGTLSHVVEMRAMARSATTSPTLVELKAVDALYPLVGAIALDPPMPIADALKADAQGKFGAVAEPALLQRLGVKAGDTLTLGGVDFTLRAGIAVEPDRGAQVFNLGPRLMISSEALAKTGLDQPGSLVYHRYLVGFDPARHPGITAADWAKQTGAAFPDAGWRVRDPSDAAGSLRRFIERMQLFLTLVGLATLLIGGLGVANAVRVYLEGRLRSLAILKCVGATSGFVLSLYLLLVARMAAIGIAIGLIFGAAVPYIAAGPLSRFDLRLEPGLYPGALGVAALFGFATALAFTLPPLLAARSISPAQLFRAGTPDLGQRKRGDWIAIALAGAALAALTVVTAADRLLALGFVGGSLLTFGLFALLAYGLRRGASRLRRTLSNQGGVAGGGGLRFALAAIARPRAPTAAIVLSLGLGLTVLSAVMLTEASLQRAIRDTLPAQAPSFYFIDIQPDQVAEFDSAMRAYPTATDLERVPMLRGRITAMRGVPADQLKPPPDLAWVLRGDRGVTWSANPPPDSKIVEGTWWAPDYKGPPLISLDAETAKGFGLKLGDSISVNVLGREITGTIANLREIDWGGLSINFVMVFSPGMLEAAPQTHIATLRVAPENEGKLLDLVGEKFPNVSAVRVKEAIASASEILSAIGAAVRATAAITLVAGMLVLAGAMAAGQQRRIYESVLLKMLGARRSDIARAFVWEFAILGLASAAIALMLGTIGAAIFVTLTMHMDFVFSILAALGTAGLALVLALVIGFAGSWRALGAKAAPYLRNE